MTREELHELVDIVMDVRAKSTQDLELKFGEDVALYHLNRFPLPEVIYSFDYPTFSDFTQSVKDYIKSLG